MPQYPWASWGHLSCRSVESRNSRAVICGITCSFVGLVINFLIKFSLRSYRLLNYSQSLKAQGGQAGPYPVWGARGKKS